MLLTLNTVRQACLRMVTFFPAVSVTVTSLTLSIGVRLVIATLLTVPMLYPAARSLFAISVPVSVLVHRPFVALSRSS